jgi:acyl-coenzyme A thioesterase PaaI-like protein
VSDRPAPAPLDAERMQAILDGSPFIHFCGMRVTALDPAAGRVVLAMELRPELERRQGTGQWHGGAIAGLIDTAGDAAVALGLGAVVDIDVEDTEGRLVAVGRGCYGAQPG